MNIFGRSLVKIPLMLIIALFMVTMRVPAAHAAAAFVRWDIVSVQPPNLLPGGIASAQANDGSTITLTGSGTFVAPASSGTAHAVTGGGDWRTSDANGKATGRGKYNVVSLVSWEAAPGTAGPLTDNIGNRAEQSSGLAVLRIEYDDGSHGILIVSCHLTGAPDTVFEGISVSKDFADYWNRMAPVPGVDANRTNFHVGR